MASESKDEVTLWKELLAGDKDAYTAIYGLHVKAMYRYGMSLVSISEDFVLDCIHDVFLEVWVKRDRLAVPDNIRLYLFVALKNRVLHLLKRQERPQMFVVQDNFEDLWSDPSAEDIQIQKEESVNNEAMLNRLVLQLPPRQQEAIRLRFVENMGYQEIGQVLDVNTQSANNLVFRAIEKLRGWIMLAFLVFQEGLF
ncbi:sigma-70 family RNA polymerase sigma factor [Dyadobacter chenwenxiniae]|uniref:Sigma-70 family RNA polymerase sigma factor n=1 Tax=Dyadobacter chenwenxiniae TaxID=2906456 RepID=A0A9X1TGN0_9BACT|nr:sigma-70 family RNA polymerase sigma factor [Dyadobacter chenwenxiniae]MCF0063805.1 sigma-70 family RNA polymerase sigma factor [Dyadobacter chenwenxiniae]UON83481.1 sigma-70 family RNA polymerase sigma factor [Dyadobacter chenwenxiniae]